MMELEADVAIARSLLRMAGTDHREPRRRAWPWRR
jgi:hypothetical protein